MSDSIRINTSAAEICSQGERIGSSSDDAHQQREQPKATIDRLMRAEAARTFGSDKLGRQSQAQIPEHEPFFASARGWTEQNRQHGRNAGTATSNLEEADRAGGKAIHDEFD